MKVFKCFLRVNDAGFDWFAPFSADVHGGSEAKLYIVKIDNLVYAAKTDMEGRAYKEAVAETRQSAHAKCV